MSWELQIRIDHQDKPKYEKEWVSVRPGNGEPYRYSTAEEAEQMNQMCYGGMVLKNDMRVIEVDHPVNIKMQTAAIN